MCRAAVWPFRRMGFSPSAISVARTKPERQGDRQMTQMTQMRRKYSNSHNIFHAVPESDPAFLIGVIRVICG
jgi:hypothetical protein